MQCRLSFEAKPGEQSFFRIDLVPDEGSVGDQQMLRYLEKAGHLAGTVKESDLVTFHSGAVHLPEIKPK